MTFDAQFWLNLLYFLIQVIIGFLSILLGVYLFYRQQRNEQNKKLDEIKSSLLDISSELRTTNTKISYVGESTQKTQSQLLKTMRDSLFHSERYLVNIKDLKTPDDK